MSDFIAGLDYSMSCPCLCVHEGNTFDFNNCSFIFVTSTIKYQKYFVDDRITGTKMPTYKTEEERFDKISDIFIKALAYAKDKTSKPLDIGIEGYAMGAKGKVFNIGENTGLLKYKLWKEKIPFHIFAPKSIKKFATGNGNASKDLMYETFVKETKVDLRVELDYDKKDIDSPIGDITDAYYICKYHFYSGVNP